MIFELIGVLFVALGLFGLHKAVEGGKEDKETLMLLGISMMILFVGCIMLISKISVEILIRRILGIFCTLFGVFLFWIFPGMGYTLEGFKNVGIFFGFILFVLGIYLILF